MLQNTGLSQKTRPGNRNNRKFGTVLDGSARHQCPHAASLHMFTAQAGCEAFRNRYRGKPLGKGRGITCVTCASEATGAKCICCRAWLLLSATNSASVFGRGSQTRNPSFRAGVCCFSADVLASVKTGGLLCMGPVSGLCEFEKSDWLLRGFKVNLHWCERGDSNPHGFTRQILSLVRLPIPPLSQLHQKIALYPVNCATVLRSTPACGRSSTALPTHDVAATFHSQMQL